MGGRVTGIGGVFFRASDPEALAAWYADHFGIEANGFWPQEAGDSVLGLFKADTDYWPKGRDFMMNFRVEDLAALTRRLEAAGIEVQRDPEWDSPEFGQFARIQDPEGNPIELWEPAS